MIRLSKARTATGIAVTWVAVVLWLTLRDDPTARAAADATAWWCLACGDAGIADQFQNLLLLLPLGAALALAGWPFRRAALAVLLLPLLIEVAQATLTVGRDAALGDVVANAAGGCIGWWLGSRLRRPGSRASNASRGLPLVGVGLFVAQLLATASLIRPWPDGPAPWRLRLNPEVADRPTYRGDIVTVALGGSQIVVESPRPAQPPDPDAPVLRAVFGWEAAPGAVLTPILRLDDGRGWDIASVDRRGDFIGLSARTLGGRLRWRTPVWLLPVANTTSTGDTITATLSFHRGEVIAAVATTQSEQTLALRYGAQHGWTLINPFTPYHDSATHWQWWTLAWLFGWGVLIGAACGGVERRWVWCGALLAALIAVCWWGGARATPAECIALASGWWLAVLLSRTSTRWSPDAA